MNFGNSIPEFIQIYRKNMGLSQTELGEKLGFTPQYIHNLEHGTSKLPKAFCGKLMKLLGDREKQWLSDLIQEAALSSVVKRPKPKAGLKNAKRA